MMYWPLGLVSAVYAVPMMVTLALAIGVPASSVTAPARMPAGGLARANGRNRSAPARAATPSCGRNMVHLRGVVWDEPEMRGGGKGTQEGRMGEMGRCSTACHCEARRAEAIGWPASECRRPDCFVRPS